MSETTPNTNPWMQALEKEMDKACYCKWRTQCTDKNSDACYAKRNLYAEALKALDHSKH